MSEETNNVTVAVEPSVQKLESTPVAKSVKIALDTTYLGIAVGGFALVVVGVILVLAVPQPFGAVLTLAGVSLWGSQVEAPKRAMKSARASLEQAAESEDKQETMKIIGLVEEDKKEKDNTENIKIETAEVTSEESAPEPTEEERNSVVIVADSPVESALTTDTTAASYYDPKVHYIIQPDASEKPQRAHSERFKIGRRSTGAKSDRSVSERSVTSKGEAKPKRRSFFQRANTEKAKPNEVVDSPEQPKDENAKSWRLSFKRRKDSTQRSVADASVN